MTSTTRYSPDPAQTTFAPPPAGPIGQSGTVEPSLSRRRYLQLVLVLGSLTALGPLTIDMYLPALPALSRDFAVSTSAVQGTLTGMLVGLAVGQIVIGPLSDAFGRRRPLLIGLTGHVLASVLCVLAPSIALLTVARGIQGFAGAALSVVSMAVVRDLFTGMAAAQLLSRLMLVMGLAPVLAPSLGSLVLQTTTWRGIFVVLGVAGVLGIIVASTGLRETLPEHRRRPAQLGSVVRTYRGLLADRQFMALVLLAGLVFASLFAYIAGSSFVLQDIYGLSASAFAMLFAANAIGLVLATQLNPLLVRRFSPLRVLRAGVTTGAVATVVMVVAAVTGLGGLPLLAAMMWVAMTVCGFSFPNTPALALSRHGESAGTAAAMLGASQFIIGGTAAPLVGAFGPGTAVPMAAVMAVAMTSAAVLVLTVVRAPEPARSAGVAAVLPQAASA